MALAVAEFQLLLTQLAADLGIKIDRLIPQLDRFDRVESLVFLTEAYPQLAHAYLRASSELSAVFYEEQPAIAPRPGRASFVAKATDLLPDERLSANARWALQQRNPAEALKGSAVRAIFDQSRQTMLENLADEYQVPLRQLGDAGTRWARHAAVNACGFCKMLATRGAVYRSRGVAYDEEAGVHRTVVAGRGASLTAGDRRRIASGNESAENALSRRERYVSTRRAAKQGREVGDLRTGQLRGSQSHADRYHDNCHCVAVPVRPGGSYEPPDYTQRWESNYVAASRESADPKVIARLMDHEDAPAIRMVEIETYSTSANGWVTKKVPADSPAARASRRRTQ